MRRERGGSKNPKLRACVVYKEMFLSWSNVTKQRVLELCRFELWIPSMMTQCCQFIYFKGWVFVNNLVQVEVWRGVLNNAIMTRSGWGEEMAHFGETCGHRWSLRFTFSAGANNLSRQTWKFLIFHQTLCAAQASKCICLFRDGVSCLVP